MQKHNNLANKAVCVYQLRPLCFRTRLTAQLASCVSHINIQCTNTE